MNSFVEAMENNENYSRTENGALTHKSSKSSLLDLFALGAAMRERSDKDIELLFSNAFDENPLYAIRCLFYIRNPRGGQGERRFFRVVYLWLIHNHPEIAKIISSYVPEFGRWDDTFYHEDAINFNIDMIKSNVKYQGSDMNLLSLFKWLPSENATSEKTKSLAKIIRKSLGISSKDYRKMLSENRKKLNIVETKMCNNEWRDIKYENIPSCANLKYKDSFLKHDALRRNNYLKDVMEGKKSINSSVLYPYEIVGKVRDVYTKDDSLEALWKNLPDYVDGKQAIVVADTSGSMEGNPINVALSLAIYFAERNKNEAFKDVFITFSQKPTFHTLKGNSLYSKLKNLDDNGWDMNTNLEAVFEYILKIATKNNVPKEEMPSAIYIVSDMEFDQCIRHDITLYNRIKILYSENNYNLPNVVFWNVNARSNNLPVTKNAAGVALVSGCSPSIFKMALGNVNPYDFMMNVLNDAPYTKIII